MPRWRPMRRRHIRAARTRSDEFQHRGAEKSGDRKHGANTPARLHPGRPRRLLDHQKLDRTPLKPDQVRHLCDFLDRSEELANALRPVCLLRHRGLSFRRPSAANLRSANWHRPRENVIRSSPKANFQDLNPESSAAFRKQRRAGRMTAHPPVMNHVFPGLKKPEIAYLPTACAEALPFRSHRAFVPRPYMGWQYGDSRDNPSNPTHLVYGRDSKEPLSPHVHPGCRVLARDSPKQTSRYFSSKLGASTSSWP